MSRLAESYVRMPPYRVTGTVANNVTCGTSSTGFRSSRLGKAIQSFRAGSVKNPKLPSGYRRPSAYACHYMVWDADIAGITRTFNPGAGPSPCPSMMVYTDPPYPGVQDWVTTLYYGVPSATAVSRLETKVLQNLKERKVNLAMAFAERRETAHMVANVLHDLRKKVRNVMNGKIPQLRKYKTFGEAWLAYRYGWTPAVSDVYGALEALEKADNGSYERYIITARAHSSHPYDGVKTTSGSVEPAYRRVTSYGGTWKLKNRLDVHPTDEFMLSLHDSGISDPALLAWELLPYSFIVDWFVNVGDYLDTFNATRGLAFLGYSLTKFHTGNSRVDLYGAGRTSNAGTGNRHIIEWSREVKSSWPVPAVTFSPELGVKRVTDALALLVNAFSTPGKRYPYHKGFSPPPMFSMRRHQ